MRKTSEIISILQQKKNLNSETAVALMLGMTQQALSERKRKNATPFEQIIAFCERENLSFDWLVLGRPDPAETD